MFVGASYIVVANMSMVLLWCTSSDNKNQKKVGKLWFCHLHTVPVSYLSAVFLNSIGPITFVIVRNYD